MTDILANPTGAVFPPDNVMATYHRLTDGLDSPLAAGLVAPSSGFDNLLVVFPQARVASWSSQELTEANVMKVETQHRLTEYGHDFLAKLQQTTHDSGQPLATKELSAWRVKHPLLRKLSLDEVPQLMYNVLGLTSGMPIDNLMQMRLIGAARPPLSTEIQLRGDNSNDFYNRAIEQLTDELGAANRVEAHEALGRLYVPGVLTPATARGVRRLNSVNSFKSWAEGIIEYGRIQRLPPLDRKQALGKVAVRTLHQVLQRTDAA